MAPLQKRSYLLKGSEQILSGCRRAELPPLRATPEDIPLYVLYEDDDRDRHRQARGDGCACGAGVHSGTLVNAPAHRFGNFRAWAANCGPASFIVWTASPAG